MSQLCFLKLHWYSEEPSCAHKLSVSQSRCGPGALLLCQDRRMFGTSRWRRMRPRKNKRTKTSLQRKRKKQSKQLSYIISPPPCWILAPTWLPYDTRDPRLCQECGRGSEQRVCVCLCVFGVVLCPAAAGQNICWMQSGQVRQTKQKFKRRWQLCRVLIRVMPVPFWKYFMSLHF